MSKSIKSIGMDVHRDSIAVAIADSTGGEARFLGEVVPTAEGCADWSIGLSRRVPSCRSATKRGRVDMGCTEP